jgi:hypothetical protein
MRGGWGGGVHIFSPRSCEKAETDTPLMARHLGTPLRHWLCAAERHLGVTSCRNLAARTHLQSLYLSKPSHHHPPMRE